MAISKIYKNPTLTHFREAPDSFSVPTSTERTLLTHTFGEGQWIIVLGAQWASNGNGYRRINTSNGRDEKNIILGNPNGENTQFFVLIKTFTTTETITLSGYQTSGSSLTVYPYISAIKLS